jgi:hypothetical protein
VRWRCAVAVDLRVATSYAVIDVRCAVYGSIRVEKEALQRQLSMLENAVRIATCACGSVHSVSTRGAVCLRPCRCVAASASRERAR